MKLCSRLLACAMPVLAIAGCNAPSTNQAAEDTPSLALQTCMRKDVQDVVGNEVKSIFQKGWFEQAGIGVLLIDPREIAAAFEQARTSFHNVSVDTGRTGDRLPTEKIVCVAALQIDESNAKQGQQIVLMPKLRWSIDFPAPVSDPQDSAFSVTLDRGSLGEDMRINGKPIEAMQDEVGRKEPAPSTDERNPSPTGEDLDAARLAGERAANAAGDAAAAALEAAAQAERELQAELTQ